MTLPSDSTARAVSLDSGMTWTAEGAWEVAPGVYRIPLPLPSDGLQAVNVYVIEAEDGLVLIDGGWAIDAARTVLERSLRQIGAGVTDIRRFLVTHIHRDHLTMATALGAEYGAEVVLGHGEKPALDRLIQKNTPAGSPFSRALVRAGAPDIAAWWEREGEATDPSMWRQPDTWLVGDQPIAVGTRTLQAVHTPGHTPGHFVFAEQAAQLLFAGDHVLSTITPSIGFTAPPAPNPLGDFMASLTKVRALPDLQLLPAHGPIAPSSHARVDELLTHHEDRLEQSREGLNGGAVTGHDVASTMGWTRRARPLSELDPFNQGLAVMETMAHLQLLVARRLAIRTETADGAVLFTAVPER